MTKNQFWKESTFFVFFFIWSDPHLIWVRSVQKRHPSRLLPLSWMWCDQYFFIVQILFLSLSLMCSLKYNINCRFLLRHTLTEMFLAFLDYQLRDSQCPKFDHIHELIFDLSFLQYCICFHDWLWILRMTKLCNAQIDLSFPNMWSFKALCN